MCSLRFKIPGFQPVVIIKREGDRFPSQEMKKTSQIFNRVPQSRATAAHLCPISKTKDLRFG